MKNTKIASCDNTMLHILTTKCPRGWLVGYFASGSDAKAAALSYVSDPEMVMKHEDFWPEGWAEDTSYSATGR